MYIDLKCVFVVTKFFGHYGFFRGIVQRIFLVGYCEQLTESILCVVEDKISVISVDWIV